MNHYNYKIHIYKMKKWLVERPHDSVVVTIMRNKSDNTYSFINLTKGHICSCRFDSVDDALKDMDKQIAEGKILKYTTIN